MQALLTHINDAPIDADVSDFLLTDRRAASAFLGVPAHALTDEQLLVLQEGDQLRLAVYIDESVLEELSHAVPFERLHATNLKAFCAALEGVSHFHYLVWCAERCREVSLLELELQAEVDKYASALYLHLTQSHGAFPFQLHRDMFYRVRFADGLSREGLHRYQEANRHAAEFCRRLDERFLRSRQKQPEAWLAGLRQFFRLGHPVKMRAACC